MKLLECNRCGSRELNEVDGYIVCAYCRSRFAPQADDLPTTDSAIGVADDITALLQRCRDDPANRRAYANLILDIDPTNREAAAYLR